MGASIKAQRDVRLVRERAKIVLNILNDDEIEIIRNSRSSLDVIAIIGNDYSGEALLEEIGLWKTKPFRESQTGRKERRSAKPGRRTCCPSRSQVEELSEEQYRLVAPVVFQELQSLVNQRVSVWKRGPDNPVYVWSPRLRLSKRSGKVFSSWAPKWWPRGVRFSVRRESFFARDACWAELYANEIVNKYLDGLARFISMCLDNVQKNWRQKKEFKELKAVRPIIETIDRESLPRHLLVRMLTSYLPIWTSEADRRHLWMHVSDLIGEQEGDMEVQHLADEALPFDPRERIGKMQIRTVNGHTSKYAGDFIFFEVFPQK